jgi:hypothetical protein
LHKTQPRREKASLSSQLNLEAKGHVIQAEAQAAKLQAAQQLADEQAMTVAGLRATLAAKEQTEMELRASLAANKQAEVRLKAELAVKEQVEDNLWRYSKNQI